MDDPREGTPWDGTETDARVWGANSCYFCGEVRPARDFYLELIAEVVFACWACRPAEEEANDRYQIQASARGVLVTETATGAIYRQDEERQSWVIKSASGSGSDKEVAQWLALMLSQIIIRRGMREK